MLAKPVTTNDKVGYYFHYDDPMDRLTAELLRSFYNPLPAKKEAAMPHVETKETEQAILMWVDLPGYPKDSISLEVKDKEMTLKAVISDEGTNERSYKSFTKVWTVPTTVDTSKIEAKFENGVLAVTMPKAEEAKAKLVKIM